MKQYILNNRYWIATCLVFITLLIDVYTDWRRWSGKVKETIDHLRGWFLRCILIIPALYLFGLLYFSIPMVVFGYAVLFNGFLNTAMGLPWFRKGTSSYWDRKDLQYPILVWVKYIGFMVFTILYVIVNTISNLVIS